MILGASGSVGSYAVQIAKHLGAKVTAVVSTSNLELARRIGADNVIDYKEKDLRSIKGRYEVIFDAVGKYSYTKIKHLLNPGGMYMTTDLSMNILFDSLITSIIGNKKARIAFTGLRDVADKKKDLELITLLAQQNKIKPIIDKVFTFDEIQKAHAHVATGSKKGNVVVRFNGEENE